MENQEIFDEQTCRDVCSRYKIVCALLEAYDQGMQLAPLAAHDNLATIYEKPARGWSWLQPEWINIIHTYTGSTAQILQQSSLLASMDRAEQLDFYATPDIAMLATVLAGSIIDHHPFMDGNKRTAALAMLCFLEINGYESTAKPGELARFIVDIANHEDIDNLASYIRSSLKTCVRVEIIDKKMANMLLGNMVKSIFNTDIKDFHEKYSKGDIKKENVPSEFLLYYDIAYAEELSEKTA